jgi:ATP-dependent DNA helicase RecG
MLLADIKNPISSLPGVGPSAAKLFAALNVFTVADLLQFYPRDYEDRTRLISLSDFKYHPKVHTIAKVIGHDWFGYGRMKTLKILVNDGTAEAELVAFNRPFLEQQLPVGTIIVVTGNFTVKYNALQSTSFEVTKLAENGNLSDFADKPIPDSGVLPVYPLTEGLNQKNVRKAVKQALSRYARGIENEIPEQFIKQRGLLQKYDAVRLIHEPSVLTDVDKARRTLIYEELYRFQTMMARRIWDHKGSLISADNTISEPNNRNKSSPDSEMFQNSLSPRQRKLLQQLNFELTQDQKYVINDINNDIDRGYQERALAVKTCRSPERPIFTMARLLQGDVGSGKTLVALFACLRIIDWGGQCAFMAPTEILARQHAETTAKLFEPLGVTVAFLTGSIQATGRTQLLKMLKNGDINILIGTHALFSTAVEYKDLQLAVIDEQHRFGVLQRNAIIQKGRKVEMVNCTGTTNQGKVSLVLAPHLLMMSATPIPQTLALTAFADLDISTIRTMPEGRKRIKTYLVREGHESNAYEAVRKELAAGHQAYFVYPAIDPGNTTQTNEAAAQKHPTPEIQSTGKKIKSAQEMYEFLTRTVYREYKCELIHSKIDEDEQNRILRDFRDGTVQILVATTVVEVGVDVPNATCMVIEQADRFGLAQLHQLRGRVGRSSVQSYCFLIYSTAITETGIARMKALRESTDGFVIAEEDLKLRGPGELTGTIQAGNLTLALADFVRDHDLLIQARSDAFSFMQRTLQGDAGGLDTAS